MAYTNQSQTFQKQNTIALLIRLALADGRLDEFEMQFIYDIALQMAMTRQEVDIVYENLHKYEDLEPPQSEAERMTILYQMLFLMKVDADVSQEEEEFIKSVGFRLGFRDSLTEDLIAVMKKHVREKVPVHEMLDNIRKYRN